MWNRKNSCQLVQESHSLFSCSFLHSKVRVRRAAPGDFSTLPTHYEYFSALVYLSNQPSEGKNLQFLNSLKRKKKKENRFRKLHISVESTIKCSSKSELMREADFMKVICLNTAHLNFKIYYPGGINERKPFGVPPPNVITSFMIQQNLIFFFNSFMTPCLRWR